VSAALDELAKHVVSRMRADGGEPFELVERLGDSDACLLRHGTELLVLKRGRPEQDEADVAWEHEYLRRLCAVGFPASHPLPLFEGRSWTHSDGRIWAAQSYLPGRMLASEPTQAMAAAGAFLARYHRAARDVLVREQRPTAAGLTQLREVTPWGPLRQALGSDEALARFEHLLEDHEARLRELGYEHMERLVIHGDATHDNIIVDADPPRIVGLIDFGSAHVAPWIADLGAALWRSGRGRDGDVGLDLERVRQYVGGYHRESSMPPELARAIPLMIQARGLQLISRRVRRLAMGQPATEIPDVARALARAEWAHAHRELLAATAVLAVVQHGERQPQSRRPQWHELPARLQPW
jgi:homoserine kinase type II